MSDFIYLLAVLMIGLFVFKAVFKVAGCLMKVLILIIMVGLIVTILGL